MRTTLNLDDDVTAILHERSTRAGRSLSREANDLIRSGLRAEAAHAAPARYEAPVLDTGRPLMDVTDIAGVLGLLDERG